MSKSLLQIATENAGIRIFGGHEIMFVFSPFLELDIAKYLLTENQGIKFLCVYRYSDKNNETTFTLFQGKTIRDNIPDDGKAQEILKFKADSVEKTNDFIRFSIKGFVRNFTSAVEYCNYGSDCNRIKSCRYYHRTREEEQNFYLTNSVDHKIPIRAFSEKYIANKPREFEERFFATAGVLLYTDSGKILGGIEHRKEGTCFSLLSGRRDDEKETSFECASREAFEESFGFVDAKHAIHHFPYKVIWIPLAKKLLYAFNVGEDFLSNVEQLHREKCEKEIRPKYAEMESLHWVDYRKVARTLKVLNVPVSELLRIIIEEKHLDRLFDETIVKSLGKLSITK